VIDKINLVSWQTELKWVSVEERLPPNLQAVLVFGHCDNQYRGGFEVGWVNCDMWMTTFVIPTHWMPLPASPKLKEENNG
jgi:hypothetical protein